MTRNTNTSPLLIYVNPLGGDYNPGLRPSQAVRTIAQAQAIALQYDLTNFPCSIFLSPGTYTEDIVLQETVGGQGIAIAGTDAGVILNGQISGVDLTSTVTFTDVTFLQTSIVKPVVTLSNANITLSNCSLILQPTANSSIYPLIALNGALITLSGTLNITYDGTYSVPGWCYAGSSGSTISAVGLAITSNTGTNFWGSAGVYVAAGGVMDFSGSTQVADTTRGSQWFVEAGATLYIVTSLLALPGDTLGSGSGTIAPRGTVVGGGTTFNAIKFTVPLLINNVTQSFAQNQISNPESLENAAFWTKNSLTSNLTSLDPQQYDQRGTGFPWMDKFNEVAATTVHSIQRTISVLGGQDVTISIVAKIDPGLTRERIFIRYENLAGTIYVLAIYNIDTSLVTFTSAVGTGAVYTSSSVTSDGTIGTCILTCKLPNDGNATIVEFGIADTDTTFSYLGVTGNGIYLADASLTLSTTFGGYQYATVSPSTLTFTTPSPTSLLSSPTGGTLSVPSGTLTAYLAGFAQATTSFTLTETSNRITVVTSSAHVVTSGGSLSELTITAIPSTMQAGDTLTITIASSTSTPTTTKTLNGYTTISYLDVNGSVQTVVKNWSVTLQVNPPIANMRAYVPIGTPSNYASGATHSTDYPSGYIWYAYFYIPGCTSTNTFTITTATKASGTAGWTVASYRELGLSGGLDTSLNAVVQLTSANPSGAGQTMVINVTFNEIPGTFVLTFTDTA